jgi:hypothetical protein
LKSRCAGPDCCSGLFGSDNLRCPPSASQSQVLPGGPRDSLAVALPDTDLPAKFNPRGRQLCRHKPFHDNVFGNYERVGGQLAGGAGPLIPARSEALGRLGQGRRGRRLAVEVVRSQPMPQRVMANPAAGVRVEMLAGIGIAGHLRGQTASGPLAEPLRALTCRVASAVIGNRVLQALRCRDR